MRGRHRFALLCACASTLAFAIPAPAAEIGFRIVATGNASSDSLGPGPVARIVRDRRSTAALFAELKQPLRREVNVDFRRRSLIVADAGYWPHSGYVILPGSIVVRGGTATFTGTVFRRAGWVLEMTMRPFVVLSVPREAVEKVVPDVSVKLRCARQLHCPPRFP